MAVEDGRVVIYWHLLPLGGLNLVPKRYGQKKPLLKINIPRTGADKTINGRAIQLLSLTGIHEIQVNYWI
jgi:hypothetical protein